MGLGEIILAVIAGTWLGWVSHSQVDNGEDKLKQCSLACARNDGKLEEYDRSLERCRCWNESKRNK